MGRLGIIAGAGDLPHIAMREAIRQGEDPIFFSILESDFHPGDFKERCMPVYITQIGKIFKLCKKNNVDRILLLGKVKKEIILKTYRFDLKTITILAKMLNQNDYTFFEVAAKEFDKEKIQIISQKTYLKPLLLPEGRYTKSKLSKSKLEDIEYGMNMAHNLATLDIGQTVVVTQKMILAVEAIEGTDETIKRGGELSRKKGAVVCKSTKANQDERFDLPTIGIDTLQNMHSSGCDTIAIRANETIVVNPKEFIQEANKLKINFISYSGPESHKYNAEKKIQTY
ncbi:MAG TPA: UDP-2,3-diacylglucosamine diphosphatase LpxI [Leptospiraceae bacterium]|nr:UDP-2,3-diacylglucosamine diphosphatase LpxI [Leptospiraceae bacterium]HMY31148.1 UDP-2,3-diacylglucosamine diphosphatase LpxI [Leptospiraceae bacterium]HMZ67318.1 UDP-2,3-diacylglucosamine diphosphatase LpxI [Leptospiraceae bacterium]HNA09074.1 UDP-2,3-diacylglucosamine diphosphatase LpxI [Leptospiraceae bacterium]HNC59711.1 UDP-2,3-diacylglucosamine diphosphatase LpxI [Leptospiraceae bacterium]